MLIKQSSTTPICFLMILSSDHITGATGLTPTVTLSKAGAAFASPAGTVAEVANGWYKLTPTSADTGTLGELLIHASAVTADPVDDRVRVVAFDPDAAANLGLTDLDAAISSRADGAAYTTARAAKLDDLDAAVSSRLAASGYTAPDNADIAAIKAKTDTLPASPAAVGSVMTLDLTQAVPTANTAQTVGDSLNAARAQGFGKWVLSGTTLTLYASDGTTVVRTFTLDSATAPTQRV